MKATGCGKILMSRPRPEMGLSCHVTGHTVLVSMLASRCLTKLQCGMCSHNFWACRGASELDANGLHCKLLDMQYALLLCVITL